MTDIKNRKIEKSENTKVTGISMFPSIFFGKNVEI